MLVYSILVTFFYHWDEKSEEKQLKQGQICFTSQFRDREGMPMGATPAFGIRSLYQGLITFPDLETKTADQPGPGVALKPPICIYQGARNTNNVVQPLRIPSPGENKSSNSGVVWGHFTLRL